MNKPIPAMTLLTLLLAFSCQVQRKSDPFQWNLDRERTHNENRNDSTKRSRRNWESDTKSIKLNGKPMVNGVFPVPDYDLADSTFDGLGNSGSWKGLDFKGRKIIHHSLYVKKFDGNREFIPEQPDEVFFTIVVLTDTVDTSRFTHTDVTAWSRNHPHYVGQGFVKTKDNEVDFVSFITADRNAYALVNMRLFDLRIGRIVLIAPKRDKTLRSLQLESPILSSGEMDSYIERLLSRDKKVIAFFSEPGNI